MIMLILKMKSGLQRDWHEQVHGMNKYMADQRLELKPLTLIPG